MRDPTGNTLSTAVLKLLRPVVHLLLRNNMSYGEFADLAKWIYIDVAAKEFTIPGRKQTISRISVITGLTRKEVARLQKLQHPGSELISQRHNRAARVIAGWRRNPRFQDSNGNPATLYFESGSGSFSDLVREHSGDIPPRAILDELLRIGSVEQNAEGQVRLASTAFAPNDDEIDELRSLGNDVQLLVSTIDQRLRKEGSPPLFQRKVAYDNLPQEALPAFRQFSARKAQALLKEFDLHLAQNGRHAGQQSNGDRHMQAGIGIFYFEQNTEEGI
ncbi:DUF6502 family protein [Candidatus Endoriftia persephone]|jgi:hypothetical protein|uniref:Uncharacterized protein n=3 Tax=Gammaproteobacteria TaxID=1236 RepID=G2FG58_9GAMM|nr:DUF6502 family protein [Candidatus Endoriftia persephone]EGV51116.1 hypothetical protein Rifp1Sym_bv00170 [endosymbiont of Riftia pachyptila (vent Ph05)]EGW54291.1 hypothetical protein TevJSym_ao00770 [endosymbiont of Tevnia jerichonana (vent Tica)]USF87411.1 DUF6502 family protein [Candidatus Endoriftia persephone]